MTGFGNVSQREDLLTGYKGKYVILYMAHGPNHSGRLIDEGTETGIARLKPFQGAVFEGDKVHRCLIPKEARARVSDVSSVEPSTKKKLEDYCGYMDFKDRQEQSKSPR